MKRAIVKMLIPSAETIAKYAAGQIQKAVNETEKQEQISKWATLASDITEVQAKVTDWLKDGSISDEEAAEIAKTIAPVIKKVIDLI